MRYSILIVIHFMLLFTCLACGRKAAPSAPEVRAPKAVEELDIVGSVEGVVLRWKVPSKNAKGEQLIDLAGFELKRRKVEDPKELDKFELLDTLSLREEDKLLMEKGKSVESEYRYVDRSVEAGLQYDYIILPINEAGVAGGSDTMMRVSFVGESSVIERMPF